VLASATMIVDLCVGGLLAGCPKLLSREGAARFFVPTPIV